MPLRRKDPSCSTVSGTTKRLQRLPAWQGRPEAGVPNHMQGLDRTSAEDSPWSCPDTATTVSKARHAEPQLLRRCSRAPVRIGLSPRDANGVLAPDQRHGRCEAADAWSHHLTRASIGEMQSDLPGDPCQHASASGVTLVARRLEPPPPFVGALVETRVSARVGDRNIWESRKEAAEVSDICLRQGDAADYPGVCRLAEAVYGVPRSLDSVRWLYQANPAGPCRLWLAEDQKTRDIVAVRPVFPWRMRVREQDVLVAQAGDAMTHPDFRGRGIFGALVKAAWSELRDQGLPFSFSFSNAGSLSVYKKITVGDGPRAGTHEVLQFQRMVYPLSLRLVRERVPGLGRLITGLVPRYLSVFPVQRFGEEFDDLWARSAANHGVLTVRDSRYLNWRFIDTPTRGFRVLGLRSRGELVGYVAFEIDAQGDGWIADLFGSAERDIVAALLRASLGAMLERGSLKASIWVARETRVWRLLRNFGFLPRVDCFPMAVHVYHDGAEAETALGAERWWAWYGDRDVESLAGDPAGVI